MPKRSRDSDISDIHKIFKKFRKLEKKLKRAERRRSSSRSREDSVHSEHNHEATQNSLEIDDVITDPINTEIESEQQVQPPPASPPPPPAPPATEPRQAASEGETISVDDDLVEILGDDPTQTAEFGKNIHIGLANRLDHILVNGLDNDTRKELAKKHLTPVNCPRINPPMLNPEIKAAMSETSVKRDKGIEYRQKQLGTAITCLSDIITTQIVEKDKNAELLKHLMDAVKVMCDSLHSDSVKRRYFALSSLKKDVNDHLMQTKIDKYLFGEGLAETLKTAKAVTKSSAEIKVPRTYDKNNRKITQQPQPSTSRGLNWKAPPPTRGQSGPQRSRQPYPPAAQKAPPPPPPASRPPPQHAASSRTSRYQQRPSR